MKTSISLTASVVLALLAASAATDARSSNLQAHSWAAENCDEIALAIPKNPRLEADLRHMIGEITDSKVRVFYLQDGATASVHGNGLSYDALSSDEIADRVRFVAEQLAWHRARPHLTGNCP